MAHVGSSNPHGPVDFSSSMPVRGWECDVDPLATFVRDLMEDGTSSIMRVGATAGTWVESWSPRANREGGGTFAKGSAESVGHGGAATDAAHSVGRGQQLAAAANFGDF